MQNPNPRKQRREGKKREGEGVGCRPAVAPVVAVARNGIPMTVVSPKKLRLEKYYFFISLFKLKNEYFEFEIFSINFRF